MTCRSRGRSRGRILRITGHAAARGPLRAPAGHASACVMSDSAIPASIPPLVGITACRRTLGAHPFHVVGDKYVRAVSDGAGVLPLAIPALDRKSVV